MDFVKCVITKTICCMTITAVPPSSTVSFLLFGLFPLASCLISVSLMLISYVCIEAHL